MNSKFHQIDNYLGGTNVDYDFVFEDVKVKHIEMDVL